MLQKVAWWFGEESSWRKELMNILVSTLYSLKSCFYFNTSVASPSVEMLWDREKNSASSYSRLERWPFYALVPRSTHTWRETLASKDETDSVQNCRGVAGPNGSKTERQLLKSRVESISGCSDQGHTQSSQVWKRLRDEEFCRRLDVEIN